MMVGGAAYLGFSFLKVGNTHHLSGAQYIIPINAKLVQ